MGAAGVGLGWAGLGWIQTGSFLIIDTHTCTNLAQQTIHRFKPELNALLDALLFGFTVLVNEPTPGMRMQHLRFVDGTTPHGGGSDAAAASAAARGAPPRLAQRLLLGLLYIGGAWRVVLRWLKSMDSLSLLLFCSSHGGHVR